MQVPVWLILAGTTAKHRAPCQPVLHHSVYVNQNSVLTGDSANQVPFVDLFPEVPSRTRLLF